ncbi:MAG: HAMP domain-containing sensor histidine kinase [Halothiobacillaceae bacterium]
MGTAAHIDSSVGKGQGTPSSSWRALRFFNAYRLTLAALLMAVHAFLGEMPPLTLPRADPFMLITAAYGLAAFVLLTLDELRLGGFTLRLQLGLTIDILALGLLGASQGTAHENIHVLMVVHVAYAGLLLGGRESLAFAALASVWLLILTSLQARNDGRADMLFTHAGVIGMTLFSVAILARTLARRLEASQRLAEQRGLDLANETQLNQLILERTKEGVLIVDGDDFARHANRAALRLLHGEDPSTTTVDVRENSAANGVPCSGRNPWLDSAERRKPLAEINPKLLEALHAWRQQPEDRLATFRIEQPARLQVRIIPLDDTSPRGPVALFIEDDASLMEQLQQAKLAALGRLTASIAHEIRNPLSAIGHASQLLEEGMHDAQERQLLSIIRKQVVRIDRIIENVLSTSRRKLARPEVVKLKPWLEDLLRHYRQLHEHEAPKIELAAEADMSVRVDPDHLEQILTILLDNALQHGRGPDGEPYVRIELTLHGPRRLPVLDVVDCGPGVAPEVRERLFEPFFTTSAQGHGLGLFVARELAEANQIGLYYHAAEHGGSCFRLSFSRLESRE